MAGLIKASNRQSCTWRRLSLLLFPLLYVSIGTLFGFVLCVTWLQEGQQLGLNVLQESSSFLMRDATAATDCNDGAAVLSEPNKIAPGILQTQDFYSIALKTGTDKVAGVTKLPPCLQDETQCTRPLCVNPKCRPWGHFYHTMYQSRLGHLSSSSTDPFQMLEIGFFHGRGYEAFHEFFPSAELHSLEISCLPKGKVEDGKWPHGNFAARNKKWYPRLVQEKRLHCGDASNTTWLQNDVWTAHMQRPDAPPLTVVVDDGSHLSKHMVQTVFFWFPRIAPGGYLVMEDIQPTKETNKFRTQFLPQLISDLHYCGDGDNKDAPCFPQLQQLLFSVHCELHICILQRNQEPAMTNLTLEQSMIPRSALGINGCRALRESFGLGL